MGVDVRRWLRGEWVEKNPAYTTYKAVGLGDDGQNSVAGRAHVVDKRALHRHATRRLIRLENAAHPGLVRPEMVGLVDHRPYCIERLPDAEALEERLWTTGPLDAQSTARLGTHLIEVVQAAHELGLVHGGIDLRSVRVEGDDVLLCNWGPVRHGHWHPHCAPETRRAVPHAPADLFGVGYILASCLHGGPIDGAGMDPSWSGRSGSVREQDGTELDVLIGELLSRSPRARPDAAAAHARLARLRVEAPTGMLSRWFGQR